MKIIACLLLVSMGVALLLRPKSVWVIAESWQFKSKGEPSSVYKIVIQVVGCILIAGSIFAIFLE